MGAMKDKAIREQEAASVVPDVGDPAYERDERIAIRFQDEPEIADAIEGVLYEAYQVADGDPNVPIHYELLEALSRAYWGDHRVYYWPGDRPAPKRAR